MGKKGEASLGKKRRKRNFAPASCLKERGIDPSRPGEGSFPDLKHVARGETDVTKLVEGREGKGERVPGTKGESSPRLNK